MALDVVSVLVAAILATLYRRHTGPIEGAEEFWQGTLISGRSIWILLALLCGFTITLIVTSKRLLLYSPTKLSSVLGEQRRNLQACFTSGLK